MSHVVFHIEDELDTTSAVEEALEEQNVETIIARSTGSAWPIAKEGHFGFALIDQRLPREDEGTIAASEEQVFELACRVGEKAPFVWLTAHNLSAAQTDITNCRGVIDKEGDVSTEVLLHTIEVFPDLEPAIVRDEVMVELRDVKGNEVTARVPTWDPNREFTLRLQHLDFWVAREIRQNSRQYFRARAWLGAERPGQLDFTEWEPMPQPNEVREQSDE